MVQSLRLFASIAEGMGLIPIREIRSSMLHNQNKGKKKKKKDESVEEDVFLKVNIFFKDENQ